MSGDMRQCIFQCLDAVRLAGTPGVDRQCHDPTALRRGLTVEHIEMRADLFRELGLCLTHMIDDVLIRDFVRMRHGMNIASRGLQRIRHIVVDPIGDILDPFRRDQVERVGGFRPCRGDPAGDRLAGHLTKSRERFPDVAAFRSISSSP